LLGAEELGFRKKVRGSKKDIDSRERLRYIAKSVAESGFGL
jgi:hypothetical protein